MPWARSTYERLVTLYPELLKTLKEKQSDAMMYADLLIRAEILKRDFTKRQQKILGMIYTFSYAYGKEWALIPKMRDFEICGVSKIKIRKELDQLVEMDIIEWNEEAHLFRMKDPREWKAAYISSYNDNRSRELFILNLRHANVDVDSLVESILK